MLRHCCVGYRHAPAYLSLLVCSMMKEASKVAISRCHRYLERTVFVDNRKLPGCCRSIKGPSCTAWTRVPGSEKRISVLLRCKLGVMQCCSVQSSKSLPVVRPALRILTAGVSPSIHTHRSSIHVGPTKGHWGPDAAPPVAIREGQGAAVWKFAQKTLLLHEVAAACGVQSPKHS